MSTRRQKPKVKPSAVPDSPVPEYIQKSGLYQLNKVTKRKLPSFEEAMLLLHIPEMARAYLKAVLGGLAVREKTALDHAGRILNYVQDKGFNISVTQQMLQQNTVAGVESPVIGFDAFARRLAEQRAGHALPSPEVIDSVPVRPADSAPEA
jgi:hypothetical protein